MKKSMHEIGLQPIMEIRFSIRLRKTFLLKFLFKQSITLFNDFCTLFNDFSTFAYHNFYPGR